MALTPEQRKEIESYLRAVEDGWVERGVPAAVRALLAAHDALLARLGRVEGALREVLAEFPHAEILDALEPVSGNKDLRTYSTERVSQGRIERWRAVLADAALAPARQEEA